MFPWEQFLHVHEGGAGAPDVGYTSTPSSETKSPSRSNASSTSSLIGPWELQDTDEQCLRAALLAVGDERAKLRPGRGASRRLR